MERPGAAFRQMRGQGDSGRFEMAGKESLARLHQRFSIGFAVKSRNRINAQKRFRAKARPA